MNVDQPGRHAIREDSLSIRSWMLLQLDWLQKAIAQQFDTSAPLVADFDALPSLRLGKHWRVYANGKSDDRYGFAKDDAEPEINLFYGDIQSRISGYVKYEASIRY